MTIVWNQGLDVSVVYDIADSSIGATVLQNNAKVAGDTTAVDATAVEGMEAGAVDGSMTGTTVKDPILSNGAFVIGITAASLIVGSVLGILLAKKKIKKGIELYED